MMCCFHILANTACCMYTDLLFPLILYISLSCQLAKICHDLYSGSLSYCFAATVLCYEVTLFEEILAKLELCFCTPYTIPSSSTIYIYNIYRDHGTKHTYTWKDLLLGYNSTTLLTYLLCTTTQKSKVLILLDVLIFSYTSCAHYIWILL